MPHSSKLPAPLTYKIMAVDDIPSVALPGRVLGPVTKYAPGPGTHIYEGSVVSSLLGKVTITPAAQAPALPKRLNKITPATTTETLATISVARHGRRKEVLPDVNHVVLARVVRLMPKQAIVVIQQVGETVLQTEWQGVIRVQDVRATEKDKVKIHESFKPGDIVRAQVVSSPTFRFDRQDLTAHRSLSVTRRTIISLPHRTSSASSWPRAMLATTWCQSAGRSTRTRRLDGASRERSRSRVEA